MCATGESRLSGSRAPLGHHTSGIHTRHEVPTCGALSAIGRRHLGDTHGVTLGDTVSPSCIPPLTCKFPRKYKALADRSADRNNPDSPLGDHPSGSQSPPPRSSPSWLSARWIVASLGAPLRWSSHGCASVSLCIGRDERIGMSFAALSPVVTANSAACRSAIGSIARNNFVFGD